MHEMTMLQWWLFVMLNWSIAAAYVYISMNQFITRTIAGRMGGINNNLFDAFVFACGVHHLVHPAAMWFGLWWLNIGVDGSVAIISVWAAIAHWVTKNDDR